MEDELKNNPITDSQNGVVVDDEDDDTPTLSSETLAALKEFLAKQNGPPVNAEPEEKEKEVALVTEDWRLSQFWYDRDTSETVAHEVFALSQPSQSQWSHLCDYVFQTVYGLLPGYHQDVNHNLQMHSSLVRRLSLEKVMEGHQCCVNAVAWNSKGSLLISGSDDTRFGYILLTTSAGIMDHEEARRKNVGGKVLGFFFTRLNFKSDL